MKDHNEIKDAGLVGFACALAELHRMHGCDQEVVDVCRGFGLTVNDFEQAGAEESDLAVIKKLFEDLPA